jgi:ankyrin repeat protein
MSKNEITTDERIISDDKEFLNLRSFEIISDPKPLSWKPSQVFQFVHPEIQKLYEEKGIRFKITRRAIEFFSQGRKPSECESPAKGRAYGQGFSYNTSLGTDGTTLIGVADLNPAWNAGSGVPATTASGGDFIYRGMKYGVFAEEAGGNNGFIHGESFAAFTTAALGTPAEHFYQRLRYCLSGGIWVGEEDHIGQIRARSTSQNSDTFKMNPLFLMCFCDAPEVHNSAYWFIRVIIPEIYAQIRKFFLEVLPVKKGQKPGITCVTEESSEEIWRIKAINHWKMMSEAERLQLITDRLHHFALQPKRDERDAITYTFKNLLDCCLEQKVSVNLNFQAPQNGNTLLHEIILSQNPNYENAEILLNIPVDVTLKNFNNKTVLDCIVERKEINDNDLHLMRMIIKNGLSFSDNTNFLKLKKPLIFEALAGRFDILLQIKELDFNYRGVGGNTLLHFAFQHKNIAAIKFLLETQHYFYIRNLDGRLPWEMVDMTLLEEDTRHYIMTLIPKFFPPKISEAVNFSLLLSLPSSSSSNSSSAGSDSASPASSELS